MEAAVEALEIAQRNAIYTMDEIERKIRASNPEASPLLDLCNRLRSAKTRLLQAKTDITDLISGQDLLRQNLTQYLIPSSEIIKQACTARNVPTPKIVFSSPPSSTGSNMARIPSPVPVEREIAAPKPPIPKKAASNAQSQSNLKRKSSPKLRKSRPQPELPVVEFTDITEAEFASLDTRTMGHTTFQEVQEVYRFIGNWYKQQEDITTVLTRATISKSGLKIRAMNTTLRFLKSLKKIDLTKGGDVTWIQCQL